MVTKKIFSDAIKTKKDKMRGAHSNVRLQNICNNYEKGMRSSSLFPLRSSNRHDPYLPRVRTAMVHTRSI